MKLFLMSVFSLFFITHNSFADDFDASLNHLNIVIGEIEPSPIETVEFDSLKDELTGNRVYLIGVKHSEFKKRVLIYSASPMFIRGGKKYMSPSLYLPPSVLPEFYYSSNTIEILFAERLVRQDGSNYTELFGHTAIRIGNKVYNFYGGEMIKTTYSFLTDLPSFLLQPLGGYQNMRNIHGLRFKTTQANIDKINKRMAEVFGAKDNDVTEYTNVSYNCLYPVTEALKSIGIEYDNVAPYDFYINIKNDIAEEPTKFKNAGLSFDGDYTYKQTQFEGLVPTSTGLKEIKFFNQSKFPMRLNPMHWFSNNSALQPYTEYEVSKNDLAEMQTELLQSNANSTLSKDNYDFYSMQELVIKYDGENYSAEKHCHNPKYATTLFCQEVLVLGCDGAEKAGYHYYDTIMASLLYIGIQNIRQGSGLFLDLVVNEINSTGRLREAIRADLKKLINIKNPVESDAIIYGENGIVFNVDKNSVHNLWNEESYLPPVSPRYRLPLIETKFNRGIRDCKSDVKTGG